MSRQWGPMAVKSDKNFGLDRGVGGGGWSWDFHLGH